MNLYDYKCIRPRAHILYYSRLARVIHKIDIGMSFTVLYPKTLIDMHINQIAAHDSNVLSTIKDYVNNFDLETFDVSPEQLY